MDKINLQDSLFADFNQYTQIVKFKILSIGSEEIYEE